MHFRFLKFLIPFTIFVGAIRSFNVHGWSIGIPLFIAWILVPLLELFIKPNASNLNEAEEDLAKKNKAYDILLCAVVFAQYFALYQNTAGIAIILLAGFCFLN